MLNYSAEEEAEEMDNMILLERFNHLVTTMLPTQWNIVQVVAVHRKGSKVNASNYRPVSVIEASGKVVSMLS